MQKLRMKYIYIYINVCVQFCYKKMKTVNLCFMNERNCLPIYALFSICVALIICG
jgi:hypothetical protein